MTDTVPSRRHLLTGGAVAAATIAGVTACTGQSSPGGNVNAPVTNINDFQDQQEKLTTEVYSRVKTIPSQKYPASMLSGSLELRNQQEKLLRFNDPAKQGFAYLFTASGALVCVLPVAGKISSTQSAMTSNKGIYKDQGTGGGGNMVVDTPGDDGSFGINEGGDMGKFFFTPEGVYVYWDGPILYLDAELDVLAQNVALQYNKASKPSSTAPAVH